jgi:hypothetical protein
MRALGLPSYGWLHGDAWLFLGTLHPDGIDIHPCWSECDVLRTEATRLEKRCATLRKRYEEYDQQRAAIEASDPIMNSVAQLETSSKGEWSLLQEELLLLRTLAEFDTKSRKVGRAVGELLLADYFVAQTEIRQALMALGYIDAPNTSLEPSKIQPGWIACHPRVITARGLYREVRDGASSRDWKMQNGQAVVDVESRLLTIRRGLLKSSP